MSEQKNKRAHIQLEADVAQYLEDFTRRSGFPSISFSAHFLLRIIKSAEISAELELKPETQLPSPPPGKNPLSFRKKLRMRMRM